jgi:hypothetical protein
MANNNDNSDLGQAIQDVSEKMSLLVREEIELAKTEMLEKVTRLAKGAAIGLAAGIFAVFDRRRGRGLRARRRRRGHDRHAHRSPPLPSVLLSGFE